MIALWSVEHLQGISECAGLAIASLRWAALGAYIMMPCSARLYGTGWLALAILHFALQKTIPPCMTY